VPFRSPDYADFPSDMTYPKTHKIFEVIVRTAKSTRENRQLEFLLKLKQNGNQMFDFLRDDSDLHPLYQVRSCPCQPPLTPVFFSPAH
jgi:hypothetical protein